MTTAWRTSPVEPGSVVALTALACTRGIGAAAEQIPGPPLHVEITVEGQYLRMSAQGGRPETMTTPHPATPTVTDVVVAAYRACLAAAETMPGAYPAEEISVTLRIDLPDGPVSGAASLTGQALRTVHNG